MSKQIKDKIIDEWNQLYPSTENSKLHLLLEEIEKARTAFNLQPQPAGWYKDAVVYALYVDQFNHTFDGLIT
ncbi:MAG: hypothetical protein WCQ70_10195, partial [Lentimicrobiaceae bacterium]